MWTLLTAMFLHANWYHLLGNMIFLMCFGIPLESKLGSLRFLALYLGAGVFAGPCTTLYIWATKGLLQDAAFVHNLGASGAIAGVIGCFLALRPQGEMRIPLLFKGLPIPSLALRKCPPRSDGSSPSLLPSTSMACTNN